MSTPDLIDLRERFAEALCHPYGDTTWKCLEVWQLGEAVLRMSTATAQLGHASPGSTLDYLPHVITGSVPVDYIHDFVAWTSGRKHLRPGCEERIREELVVSGLYRTFTEGLFAGAFPKAGAA